MAISGWTSGDEDVWRGERRVGRGRHRRLSAGTAQWRRRATVDREGNLPLLATTPRCHSPTPRNAPSILSFSRLAARLNWEIWRLGFPNTRGATDAASEQPWR